MGVSKSPCRNPGSSVRSLRATRIGPLMKTIRVVPELGVVITCLISGGYVTKRFTVQKKKKTIMASNVESGSREGWKKPNPWVT